MTTKEILERMSRVVDQTAEEGIDPWNLPVKVLLKRIYEDKNVSKEYNVLCLNSKLYNHIVITEADKPMTFKEFLMCMSTKSEEKFWYVHDVFGTGNVDSSRNVRIMNMGVNIRDNKILIIAERWMG